MLVADRFLVLEGAPTIDLATGGEVSLVVATAGGTRDQQRWGARCDQFLRLRHPAMATLIDFGVLGEGQRFEAWRCGGPWRGSAAEAARVADLSGAFLTASGLTRPEAPTIHTWHNHAVLLPDAGTGYDAPLVSSVSGRSGLEMCGLAVIDQPVVAAVSELLDEQRTLAPLAIALDAPAEAGLTVVLDDLARVARLHGYVPLALKNPAAHLQPHVAGRSLFLISDEGADEPWYALAEWTTRSPRPHVLVLAGHTHTAGRPFRLERVSCETLVRAVRPVGLQAVLKDELERAARRSKGLPARFARLLWNTGNGSRSQPPVSKAAERAPTYRGSPAPGGVAQPTVRPWPVPEDLTALQARMTRAIAQLSAGRHAAGERGLRQSIGGLVRRTEWAQAAHGALALATSLLKRGRVEAATAILADAQAYVTNAGRDASTLELTTAVGRAAFDAGQLDRAESALQAAVSAACGCHDSSCAQRARLELARCLFWRGRYRDAEQTLAAVDGAHAEPAIAIQIDSLASGIALGLGDLSGAVSRAALALEAATAVGDPELVAIAACAAAWAHLRVEDRSAVDRDVGVAVRAARRAHDPLCAMSARLIGAECHRRMQRMTAVSSLLARVGKLAPSALPYVLRARLRLLDDLVTGMRPPQEVVARHAATTGLGALVLFAPQPVSAEDSVLRDGVKHVLDILRVCQADDEETAVLRELCTKVRDQLGAASVSFFSRSSDGCALVAGDGTRLAAGSSMADRVLAAAQFVAPHQPGDGIEAGAPVRYGADLLGAIVARWPLGSRPGLPLATLVLTTAAAAAGPAVAGALARRAAPPSQSDIIGISRVMGDVRQTIERAAAAPFAVLVVGESGSGKELVARALHRRSSRRDRPFRTLNCAALPDDLLESELFGHARGAFTGAVVERPGILEEAHTGTVFLDEVGELSVRAQAKLLRTIQEGEIRRVGENAPRRIDVRIVSATNRDLRAEVAAGRFRLDLLYRLDVLRICLPPLRDRREDIPPLVHHVWHEAAARVGSRAVLSAKTLSTLTNYSWPGNVRELQNVLASLAVRCPKRGVIPPTALPAHFNATDQHEQLRLSDARRTFEERFVRAALARTGGHRVRAAAELGVSRQGLNKLMARLRIVDRDSTP